MSFDFVPTQAEIDQKASPKPRRGEKLLDGRDRSHARVLAEQKLMREAVRLDEHKCRVPRCQYAPRKLPIDPCHKVHRGMGGNPKLDRTTLEALIALCRIHHGDYDAGRLDIDEQDTVRGFRGLCDYYAVDLETGRREHIGSDKVVGISEERNPA